MYNMMYVDGIVSSKTHCPKAMESKARPLYIFVLIFKANAHYQYQLSRMDREQCRNKQSKKRNSISLFLCFMDIGGLIILYLLNLDS